MGKKPTTVATVILAGGHGKRLHPLTIHHSKPAIAYGGRYRLIDIPISNSINSDFRQIFVIAQYLSGELQHHIQHTYHFDVYNPGSVDVLTPQENEKGDKEWFHGTADAVRKSLPTLLKSTADYFLILAGDQLYNIDFQSMVAFAEKSGADLTIASIPVLEKEAKRMGLLQINAQAKVIDFAEKPTDKKVLERFRLRGSFFKQWEIKPIKGHAYLGSMGIYVFKRSALTALLKQDKREDFGYHLITTAVKKKKTSAYIYCGYWEDIGTVASYYEANLALANAKGGLNTYDESHPIYSRPTYLPGPKIRQTLISDSIVCEGCIIEAKEITGSIIGIRSHIKKGTIIRDSVLMGNHFYMPPSHEEQPIAHDAWIGENCRIEKAIIDEHVQIGNHVKLINKKKLQYFDGPSIYVRDGIIIVTSGTKLPNYFEF
ncbi:MAG: glucose-1-phosphate adenylyltransferase [Verrucomicrobia bacterium]|nr:glucose-1-phosphate adenylyltransferase [Verrucomicrobiota bacterium]MBU6446170.1 glucose-1-phosphate adenylyltransferase [Verrucomicrobiota bacterium]MDE3047761.1 glucose-1-phosphate adenylyltransferase [Verrucomicrobiota bacterium]